MQGSLTFYGTVGDRNSTLEIDRTGPIDLTPFFEDLFHRHHERVAWKDCRSQYRAARPDIYKTKERTAKLDKNFEITDKLATFTFKMEDFYSMMLYEQTPKELSKFLEVNMIDVNDFGNDAMLKRLAKFDEDYARIYFHYTSGPYVLIQPLDGIITPKDIEGMVRPSKPKNQEAAYTFNQINNLYDNNGKRNNNKRIVTHPYHCRLENHLEKVIQNRVQEKKIIRVYRAATLDFNMFSIISHYKLPIEHLEIILKNPQTNPNKE
jgi:hypothetical protein